MTQQDSEEAKLVEIAREVLKKYLEGRTTRPNNEEYGALLDQAALRHGINPNRLRDASSTAFIEAIDDWEKNS